MNIEILKNIVQSTKSQGIMRKINCSYPDIVKYINKFKIDYNISNSSEAIYLIIHEMIEPPLCPSLSDKCLHDVRFKSIKEGYSKYCKKCFHFSDEYQKKRKQTCINNYGVDHPMKTQKLINKIKNTCLEKYGVDSINKLQDVKDKKKETLTSHYGSEGLSHIDIRKKKIETNQLKYGTNWGTQTLEVQQKRIQTCLDKYGVDHIMKVDSVKSKFKKINNIEYMNYINSLIKSRNYQLLSDYNHAHTNIKIKCNKCNHEFEILWNSFQQGGGVCPNCYPKHSGISYQEKEIGDFIKSLNINIIENDKSIIAPLELDIVIPSKKLAIEFCGLWCHSTGGNAPYLKDENYHKDKLIKANDAGYNLITIFEDEWILQKDIIKSKLQYLLGQHNQFLKIRASKCKIHIVNYKEKHEFLDKYHLQKDKVSKLNIGLYYNDKLVSIMTLSEKDNGVFELDRFCTLPYMIVYGAASRLLSYFKNNYNWSKIISFADRRWSIGNVYNKIGFKLDYCTEPNYWYWGKGIKGRKHRLNYYKSSLKNMKSYNDNLTEKQIMALEGYAWIYDCGNYKFIMKNSDSR